MTEETEYMNAAERPMRKIPFFGRVATEATFRSLEADVDTMIEAVDRMARRAQEDRGWQDISQPENVGLSDLSPERRARVVKRAVTYWLEDPQVGNAIDLYNYYIFGRGLTKPRCEFDKAQEIVDEFWDDNDNKIVLTSFDAQIQKSTELQVQGNIWFTLFIENGRIAVSDLLDAEVKDVIVHPENRKKHLFYKRVVKPVRYDFEKNQYIPATEAPAKNLYHADWRNYPLSEEDEYKDYKPGELQKGVVYHVSINRLSDGKFGNPRVLRILDWAYSYNQFMRARVSLMEAAAWLAWKRKMKGDPTQIRKVAAGFVQSRFDAAGMSDGNDGSAPAPPPARFGAMVTENENTSLEFVKTDTASANAKNDGTMLKAQIGSGTGFPLHYFGDASDGANLATATAMELPVLKMCEAGQEMWEGVYRDIIDAVILEAIKDGALPKPKRGKFSNIDSDKSNMIEGSAREKGFSEEWIESMLEKYGDEVMRESENGTKDIDLSKMSGDDIYAYDLSLPPILQRQLSETINSVVNMVTAFDPNGENDDLVRWAYEYCLNTFNVPNVAEVMERVMPKDKDLKRGPVPDRGPMRVIDNKPKRPKAEGPTRAWTPEDHAAAGHMEAQTDTPLLDELKAEFDRDVRAIHDTLTDELLAAAIGPNNGNADSNS